MTDPQRRIARARPLAPRIVERGAAHESGTADAELLERLEEALAQLPAQERAAAVVAFGVAEGTAGVAAELGLGEEDAEALARSALQLLRARFADLEPDPPEPYGRLRPGVRPEPI